MDADLASFSYDIYAFGTQVCDSCILFYRFYYLAEHNKNKVDYGRDVIGLPLTPDLCCAVISGYCPLLLFTQVFK